ncbi:hypothetical protein [Dyadobacter tibetensis]|uniref:hypothetical protein n=1 Tax=Dyadobacter tibetensis TaxID=1211851 RepID=UPI00047239E1|nr:hypothetical protein [Dyadobacter tibetensis]
MIKTTHTPYLIFLIAFICLPSYLLAFSGQPLQDSIITKKIWDGGTHNAFPDIIRYKNAFYCSFREGQTHVDSLNRGIARIIKSKDGENWETVAILKSDIYDLRDPKLSITPQGKLMVIMAGSIWGNLNKKFTAKEIVPMVAFSDKKGETFTSPELINMDTINEGLNWIWRVTWHKGTGYGVVYHMMFYRQNEVFLMKTKNGRDFEMLSKLEVDGAPSEATVRFDKKGKMFILLRRIKNGMLITGKRPYKNWTYEPLDYPLGGPNFLFRNKNKMLVATRGGEKNQRTIVQETNRLGQVEKKIALPSGGDTGYPGMLIYKGKLWVAYYSSHEKKVAIYLSKIPLDKTF